jgi:hypothetical protein
LDVGGFDTAYADGRDIVTLFMNPVEDAPDSLRSENVLGVGLADMC